MTVKKRLQLFLQFIESKKQHRQTQVLSKMVELGLDKTQTWRDVKRGTPSVSKNTLKGIVLYNLVEGIKDQS